MFVLILKYSSPLSEIDKAIPAHAEYLKKNYALGKFICSGRQNPRTGGIILCSAKDRTEVKSIIAEDPFYIQKLTTYEIIEFVPSMYVDQLKPLLS